MYYLAMVWEASDARALGEARALLGRFQASASDWRLALDQRGLILLVRSADDEALDAVHVLPNEHGAVIGRLFESSYAWNTDGATLPSAVRLDEQRTAAIIGSGGRRLIDRYWGRYVAFLRDPARNTTWVLRDPSGAIPCHTMCFGRVRAYFIRVEDCERLGPVRRVVNQRYLLGYLMYDSVCVRATGLEGIETVLAGECVEHNGGEAQRQFYWNPLEAARRDVIEDTGLAVRLTRQITRACVHAWASCFDGILLDLSGGLDSTIVSACLAAAPSRPRVVCRHNYAASGDLDERHFARLAAQRGGHPLLEHRLKPAYDLLPIAVGRKCLSPFPQLFDPAAQREHLRLMRAEGLTAHFTGDGGDEVFYRGGPLPTAVDYAWRHGMNRKMLAITLENAAYARCSFWRTLRTVIGFGVFRHPWSMAGLVGSDRHSLMCDDMKSEAHRDPQLWHPLFQAAAAMEPCKFSQAYNLVFGAARGYAPGSPDDSPPHVTPLGSQPLMELSLRIPTYVLTEGGRDRTVARSAFAAELPAEILRRRSKGSGDSHLHDVLWNHIDSARELLLDGFLVNAGFLDRVKVEAVLSGGPTRVSSFIVELAAYLDVEKWVRASTAEPVRAVA